MARVHGRSGRVYMNIASGGLAEPIAFLNAWSVSFETDKADVTSFGDSNKVYVAGLPDSSGEFSGFYDDTTAQTYTAAVDGIARKFYLYPTSVNTQYWYGYILPDFSVNAGVGGAIEISASWNASSAITKQG